jgi:hypothetical protein
VAQRRSGFREDDFASVSKHSNDVAALVKISVTANPTAQWIAAHD